MPCLNRKANAVKCHSVFFFSIFIMVAGYPVVRHSGSKRLLHASPPPQNCLVRCQTKQGGDESLLVRDRTSQPEKVNTGDTRRGGWWWWWWCWCWESENGRQPSSDWIPPKAPCWSSGEMWQDVRPQFHPRTQKKEKSDSLTFTLCRHQPPNGVEWLLQCLRANGLLNRQKTKEATTVWNCVFVWLLLPKRFSSVYNTISHAWLGGRLFSSGRYMR